MLRQLWRIASKVKSIDLKKTTTCSLLYILSKIDYCNSLYFGLPAKYIKNLQRLINASVRFVFCLKIGTSTTLYLKRAHLLPVNLRINFKICVLVFKCLNGFAPAYLSCLIKRKVSLQSLRISNDNTLLQLPDVDKRNFKNRCFSKAAPRIWNSLPRSIREIRSLFEFKSCLKTYLFDKFWTCIYLNIMTFIMYCLFFLLSYSSFFIVWTGPLGEHDFLFCCCCGI